MSKIKPLFDNLLIEPLENESTTPSGIVLPESAKQDKPQEGKVVAVGAGSVNSEGKKIDIVVKKGDVVIYKKWGGTEIKVDGKEMLLVKQEDILAVVEEK